MTGEVIRVPEELSDQVKKIKEKNPNKSKGECLKMLFKNKDENIIDKANKIEMKIRSELEGYIKVHEIDETINALQLPIILKKIYENKEDRDEMIKELNKGIGKSIDEMKKIEEDNRE